MTKEYVVIKMLSNNVVVTQKDDNYFVLLGKGIGFGKKKGDIISEGQNIEHKFIQINDKEKHNYENVLKNIDEEVLALTEEIIALASEKLGEELNSHIHVALADHINFAIKRIKEGIDIVNPFLYEIRTLYPIEYSIAEQTIKLVKDKLGIELPESEVGFITLHIYSARVNTDVSDSLKWTRIVKEVVDYISKRLNITLNEKSLEYSRLISHLRYAIYRIEQGKNLENMFLPSVKKQLKKEFEFSREVCDFISKKLNKKVPEDEVGYIAVHIHRLLEKS
ncbi:transcriptional antiterminator [Clostridium tetanomorphum]|uniref:PRD domain-containing protein n=1 Tax=Clostridium tetanomorphum TaxID=1553 RepID=A0A923J0P0_CLOTT|nr:PRD domain-containing protein [Clostridium tetanomorphum]KAJ53439.1 transcriptional antiterminator [Clostridium tetanomorphum DSM 665]MBC2398486.1 PRD domain-containing protein [Clostridium tetanomorphum]MBP1865332.1 transcriptional antiterminator [Clostridium tetanomorphum]NRS85255.1 transcriptional antiterminator [Clostridium tetanomorphum]NRZ98432.1 transcriptional antiterminator [Clostridium tetanomorphum]